MNNLKKEISSGAFTLRFILAFIIVTVISGVLFNLIQTPLQNLNPFQSIMSTNSISTTAYIFSVIISILLIAEQAIVGFFSTKLSLLNVIVKKEDALKAKRNMKIFLGIIVFLAVITILGIALIVMIPMLQRQINNPTGNMESLLIPIAIIFIGSIISLVVLTKTCRKTFDRIVFGDGTHKNVQTETNQINQQVPIQTNTNEPVQVNQPVQVQANTPEPVQVNQPVQIQTNTTTDPIQTNNNQ